MTNPSLTETQTISSTPDNKYQILLELQQKEEVPFAFNTGANSLKRGTCDEEQVGVKAPGRENNTTVLPANRSSLVNFFLSRQTRLEKHVQLPPDMAPLPIAALTSDEGDIGHLFAFDSGGHHCYCNLVGGGAERKKRIESEGHSLGKGRATRFSRGRTGRTEKDAGGGRHFGTEREMRRLT